MPLSPGSSRGIIGSNIREMMGSGHPQAQAVAASLNNARRHPAGIVGKSRAFAEGGELSWLQSDKLASHTGHATTGFLHSAVPGRTDLIHAQPPVGSFVIPADVVSGVGEGNSLAGADLIQKALSTGPYGTTLPKGQTGGLPIPRPPARFTEPLVGPAAKRGGRTQAAKESQIGRPTPILAAGGEFIVRPEYVHAWGGGDYTRGHDVLDAWVIKKRREIAHEMLKLKPPKKR